MARETNYTIGAGKLFFNRLDANGVETGEFYIGNTTSITGSVDEQKQEHYSSDEHTRSKDDTVVTRSDNAIAFTTDDIQPENLAMIWKGTADVLATGALADQEETIVVNRGRWYQLGVDATNPTGLRALTVSAVTDDAGPPVAIPGGDGGANYELDELLGRIFIKEDATDIADGDSIILTYDVAASTRTVIITTNETIKGSLRYIADNVAGVNRDDFWPLVQISPNGDYEFKSDSWSEMKFTGEVLKKGTLAKHYTDGRPVV